MTRKQFLQTLQLGVYSFLFGKFNFSTSIASPQKKRIKNWLWLHPWNNISDDEYKKRFDKIKESGIDAILPNIYGSWRALYTSQHLPYAEPLLEKLLPFAKSSGLEVHAWMWTMICNIENILEKHPNWFAVNRNGESTIEKPAYVNYYRFMCPNNIEVQEFITKTVTELSNYSELTGVHLDYVRYPDVILAERLQKKYDIVQDKEYPEYDYCYCETCKKLFKDESGIDISKDENAETKILWKQFRYDSLTKFINNKLIPAAKKKNKVITAAVFPNWENVRQQWSKWNLDGVHPMLYNDFYNENVEWIVKNIIKGKQSLNSATKLFSGLMVDSFDPREFKTTITKAIEANADGVSLFAYHSMKDGHWESLKELTKSSQ
ncbi:MAG: family 10 glycosylhydrolase [Ignavibacteriales bacterium]|nr:family 10 glycosylhydrolase [Ignavibacteriales bacterium]